MLRPCAGRALYLEPHLPSVAAQLQLGDGAPVLRPPAASARVFAWAV